uniref:NADH dehydrogenase subunit 2 n=1 Tax=Ceramothamnion japonicum TaxID=218448 RepID=A0A0E3DBB6_CERJP|nr:NADH dehydrogenase subunit 2 [Ceramium japonicum]
MSLNYNWYCLSSDIFLIFSSLSLLIFGVLLNSSKRFGAPVTQKTFHVLISFTLCLSLILLHFQIPLTLILWNGFLLANFFTYYAKIFILILTLGISSLTLNYLLTQKLNFFEHWLLLLLLLISISLVLHSFDLLSMYIAIEFQSLIFYILASVNRTSEFSTESGLKYFILGAFSSAFLLLGAVLLYSFSGLTNLLDFSKLCAGFTVFDHTFSSGIFLGIWFTLIALFFKFSIAPFHFWSPDVYDGAPFSVTATFAVLPKIALGGLFIKLLYIAFFNFLPMFNSFLLSCCFLSSFIGILGAFLQNKWKRFIAYSSIGHSSFVVLGLLANDFSAAESIFIFIIIYSITTLTFFLVVNNLCFFNFPNAGYLRWITNTKNLARINKTLSVYLLIVMFSLAGVPPLAGFFSKFFILFASLKTNYFGLPILLILFNCVASFYYLRFVKLMFFDSAPFQFVLIPMSHLTSLLTTFCIFFLLFLILDLEFLIAITKLIALSLIQ